MAKVRLIGLIAIIVVLSLTGCSGGTAKQEQGIAIGHVAALTGDLSRWGQAEKNALEITAAKLNASGGVAGKKIRIISYDTGGDASETVKAAQRLVSHDRVSAIIGPAQSSGAIVMNAVMEPAKIPFIATIATSPKVTLDVNNGKVKEYAFCAGFSDSWQGTVAARFAGQQLKVKTAAVIHDARSEQSSVSAASFVTQFAKQGGKVLASEAFKANDTDFRPILNRVLAENPAVVFLPIKHKEAALLVKQARDLGMTARFIGGDEWRHPDILPLGGPAMDGSYFVAQTGLDDPDIQPFIAEYRNKFGQEPILPNAVLAAEGLLIVVQAMQKTASSDPVKIAEQMAALTDATVLTGKLTMDAGTHGPLANSAIVQQIQSGKVVFSHKLTGD
jgi:branched-chain amino acid transport system substrate-binding protein